MAKHFSNLYTHTTETDDKMATGYAAFTNSELVETERELINDKDQSNVDLKYCKEHEREGIEMAYSDACRELDEVRTEMKRRGIA